MSSGIILSINLSQLSWHILYGFLLLRSGVGGSTDWPAMLRAIYNEQKNETGNWNRTGVLMRMRCQAALVSLTASS